MEEFRVSILEGKTLKVSNSAKYLGVIMDKGLRWNDHLEHLRRKLYSAFWLCRKTFGNTWSITPKVLIWLRDQVFKMPGDKIPPKYLFGSGRSTVIQSKEDWFQKRDAIPGHGDIRYTDEYYCRNDGKETFIPLGQLVTVIQTDLGNSGVLPQKVRS